MEVMYCSCCGSQNVIGRPSCWKCSTMFSSMTANNGTDSFQGHGIVAGSHPLPPPSLIQSQVSQAVAPGLPGACNAAGATNSACAGFPVPLGPGCFKNLRVAYGSDQGGQPLQKHEILFDPNGPRIQAGHIVSGLNFMETPPEISRLLLRETCRLARRSSTGCTHPPTAKAPQMRFLR